jgi:hypothetical protein
VRIVVFALFLAAVIWKIITKDYGSACGWGALTCLNLP